MVSSLRIEDCSFAVGSETLVATKVYGRSGRAPSVVSFHGTGATSDRNRVRYLLDYLAEHEVSSLCFDFSGHGESTGNAEHATLNVRLTEARAAVQLLGDEPPQAIVGSSMGGYLAAMLVPVVRPRTLILISPAAYPAAAMDCRFSQDFYTVARRPGAYLGSPVFDALSEFRGNLLVIGARRDAIIPSEVLELYVDSAPRAKFRNLIWLEEADHKVHAWLQQHEHERARLLPIMVDLIRG